jgi:hypothetical protein
MLIQIHVHQTDNTNSTEYRLARAYSLTLGSRSSLKVRLPLAAFRTILDKLRSPIEQNQEK